MNLSVKTINGAVYAILVEPSWTIEQFKDAVFQKSGIPADMIRLIAAGRVLEDALTIGDYNLHSDAVVSLVLTMRSLRPAVRAPVAVPHAPTAPKKNEALEKCWSAAYSEEWEKAKSYLESGEISLDELEQRTHRDLLVFFAERNMANALAFIIAARGMPQQSKLLAAVNMAIKGDRGNAFDYLLTLTSVAELQTVEGAAQPLHYALCFGRVKMLRYLLDNGADPNFYAETGNEGLPNHPGTPMQALAQSGVPFGSFPHVEECITIISSHPAIDLNARHREKGGNALHLLVAKNNSSYEKDLAIALIKVGVDTTALNNDGKMPEQCLLSAIALDGTPTALARVFILAKEGKIKASKRPAGDAEVKEEAGDNKKSRQLSTITGPTFHTLDAKTARVREWTRELNEDEQDDDSGAMRSDKGKMPLSSAILSDLPALAADSANPLHRAAQIALDLADKLEGVLLSSETDCSWFPFVVDLSPISSGSSIKNLSLSEAIKHPKVTSHRRE